MASYVATVSLYIDYVDNPEQAQLRAQLYFDGNDTLADDGIQIVLPDEPSWERVDEDDTEDEQQT